MHKSLIIAAPSSGSGKTTISIGIMAALMKRGLTVQPFKVGPDFIDPQYHRHVTGRQSHNLDGWMMGKGPAKEVYARGSKDAGVSVIEGVMGLYDGIGAKGLQGSTAEAAELTGAPVILVVDARSMAGSVAALVRGFETHMDSIRVAGVILNRVGSERHEKLLREAVKRSCKARVIGAIPRTDGIDIPSRHLGLTTDVPGILTKKFLNTLTGLIDAHVDMDALLKIASRARKPDAAVKEMKNPKPKARLAVAMDEAFCFYYQYNLDLLAKNGLEIVPFSPLKDGGLPDNISGIYIGGGYPEMYARGLGMNDFIKRDIMDAAEIGIPIYAECGGLMYLTEGIRDTEGVFHPMVGLLPTKARMLERRKALGYREVTIRSGKNLFTPGKKARGHEFHYSDIDFMPTGVKRVYKLLKPSTGEVEKEGYVTGSVLASYVHLHFASNREFAKSFAEKVKSVRVP